MKYAIVIAFEADDVEDALMYRARLEQMLPDEQVTLHKDMRPDGGQPFAPWEVVDTQP